VTAPDILASCARAALFGWVVLAAANGGFWRARETDAEPVPEPAHWPAVTAVVPARDEAAVIAQSLNSLLAQDYPGAFRVVLVDDHSSDGTGAIARGLGCGRLSVIDGAPLASGWTGKLWAVRQGVEAAGAPDYLWLTDADIAHAPDTLRSLVARSEAERLVLNSAMVRLATESFAEKAIVPAFVWFFAMLYPFAQVNDPDHTKAAAAGGSMLARRDAFEAAGGIASIRSALIDDCALGAVMKRQGRIRLQLTDRSRSLRAYGWRELFQMTARSAYAQLKFNPLLLLGTVAALALLFFAPPLAVATLQGGPRLAGAAAAGLMAGLYQPMLTRYGRSPLWGFALPLIGAFYLAATLWSAVEHLRGRGGMWKGRAQAVAGAGV